MTSSSDLDRRRFLQLVGLGAGGAAAVAAASPAAANQGKPGRGRTVTVLGGGLAGLCAAYELRNKGYTITAILEGQQRTGGRVQTLRDGFANGQYVELGAARIPDSHDYTLGYAGQFNLPLVELPSGDSLYYLKGQDPFVHVDGAAWPSDVLPGLVGEDSTLGATGLAWKYDRGSTVADPASPGYIGDPRTANWPIGNANASALLAKSYRDYWRDNGAPDDAFLINRAANGSEVDSVGALYWLSGLVVDAQWNRTHSISGGTDQLPAAFTAQLADVVRYSCKVTGIHQGARSATVTFRNAGRTSTLQSDFVVCALPFSTLRDVKITPAMPDDKMTTIRSLRYMPVSRSYMQTKTRFWESKGIGGLRVAGTDTGVDRLLDSTLTQSGSEGILMAYMQNQTALDYASAGGSYTERSAYARDIVTEFFPEIEDEFIGGVEKIWQDDPWVKGAWAWFAAGEQDMFPITRRPEGRVHFCGDHTSPWSGWMQGALESANRVVNEITST